VFKWSSADLSLIRPRGIGSRPNLTTCKVGAAGNPSRGVKRRRGGISKEEQLLQLKDIQILFYMTYQTALIV
jgi:hypothetical protein